MKSGGSSCCHCSIRLLSHRWASSYARRFWGKTLLARAPDLVVLEWEVACMSSASSPFGIIQWRPSLRRPIRLLCEFLMPRDFMGINGKVWDGTVKDR
jgi:hypothetical protein